MKEVNGKLLFGILFLLLITPGIFAVDYGTCAIVERSACSGTNDNIVMGLSSTTNAHGQLVSETSYPYVLCCNFGKSTGSTTCTQEEGYINNEILFLSSTTNAHAEIPNRNNYANPVCYEDFECVAKSSCLDKELGILSLSSETNAHIGTFDTYSTKICCNGTTIKAGNCKIESAQWEVTSTQEGNSVRLNVTGNEAEYCKGLRISFDVLETDGLLGYDDIVKNQPADVSFNGATATGQWTAEYGDDEVLDPEYIFNVSLEIAPNVYLLSSNELSVSKTPENYCLSYGTCSDYKNEGSCKSDYCNVAEDDAETYEVTCDSDTLCGCNWDISKLSCGFNFLEIVDCGSPESGCGYGCTLCNDATSEEDYCIAGSTCRSGDEPDSDNDGMCEFGEGCLSADCEDGDKDTCNNGLFCNSGRCFSFEDPALWLDQCILNETVISGCEEEPVGYKVIDINGVWTGEQRGSGYETCIAYTEKSKTVSCPAQIELPFFDVIGFVIALMVIAIIYTALIFKKKEHHKKRHKK